MLKVVSSLATTETLRTDPNEYTVEHCRVQSADAGRRRGNGGNRITAGLPPRRRWRREGEGRGAPPATSSDNWRDVATILAARSSKVLFEVSHSRCQSHQKSFHLFLLSFRWQFRPQLLQFFFLMFSDKEKTVFQSCPYIQDLCID